MSMYILDDQHKPVKVDDMNEWADYKRPHVALTKRYGHRVSTVFLGLDHNFGHRTQPVLFETMIFGPWYESQGEYQERCSTWNQAVLMHKEALEQLDIMKYLMTKSRTIGRVKTRRLSSGKLALRFRTR